MPQKDVGKDQGFALVMERKALKPVDHFTPEPRSPTPGSHAVTEPNGTRIVLAK